MELYITELSKYIITLFAALYTLEAFLVFRYPDEERRKGGYMRQNLFMFLVHFSCFLVICFETGKLEYLLFYALQQILLFATIVLFCMIYPKGNRLIVNNMCMLLSIGFVVLSRLSVKKAIRQIFIVTISIISGMLIPYRAHLRLDDLRVKAILLHSGPDLSALGVYQDRLRIFPCERVIRVP